MPLRRYSVYKLKDDTIEIDGIRMHQTLKKSPIQDSIDKVKLLRVKKNYKVLDICTGLGYTAIELAKRSKFVITIENDENVINLARKNLKSKDLFLKENIQIIIGNAEEIVKVLPSNYFDAIMHDPPRFSRAGELYSYNFYVELYRILKNNSFLFHYTGKPGEKSGKNIPKGVKKRLIEAGFKNVKWIEDCLGFLCRK